MSDGTATEPTNALAERRPNEIRAGVSPLQVQYSRFVRKRLVWLLLLGAVLLASFLVNVATGPASLPVTTVLNGLIAPDSLPEALRVILWEVRLPYAVMALAVGACLGLAGAEMQTVLNNPLASPATLGVTYAATLGASLVIVFDFTLPWDIPQHFALPVFAFIGAVLSILLIQFLAKFYGPSLEGIILFGIAIVFALQALVSLIQFAADSDSLQQIVFWTMGSLSRATWDKTGIITVVLAICFLFSIRQVWNLTVLRNGEEFARSAGVPVERLRFTTLLRVSVVAAVAVAFTGVIGFVGLVGPHIARLICGEDHRFYLPGSALAGALMLSAASLASKTIIPGVLIPDGIVTALVGVPLFLALLLSHGGRWR
ncbi:FecCD family ABC transporter permease [Hwanghaeella sp.]|uniref:FecCD family ABC transporter permease n=1 Tax=Hwanghaeella sp. TaxID=2605943 RepID=UPI003CCB852C